MIRRFIPLKTAEEYPEIFYRIPTLLFDCEQLQELSAEALFTYGVLFHLAYSEGNTDAEGSALIRFTQVDLAELLRCGREHARAIWRELDKHGIGLIEQVRVARNYMLKIMDFRQFMTTIQ